MTFDSASHPLNVSASPDELVRQLRTLPPVPKVMLRLQPLLSDVNRSSLDELASVIRLERALAARILQVSNSAFVGLGERARSIEEAISRLGFREVRRLVTLVIGMQIMDRPLPAYGLDSKSLWRQSIACGLAAEELAKRADEDSNAAYALGLLHSIGMVVINAWSELVAKGQQLTPGGYPDDYTASERRLLGFTNADTGAALLRRWDFPASVIEPVRAQYQPLLAASNSRLAHLLLVARWIRSAVCDGQPPQTLPEPRSMAMIGVTPAEIAEMVPLIGQRLEEAARLLSGG